MKNAGLAAFLHQMLNRPVHADSVRNVPITDELRNQQEETMSPEMSWLMGVLDSGTYVRNEWPDDLQDRWIEAPEFYGECVTAFRNHGYRADRMLNPMSFGKRLGAIISTDNGPLRFPNGKLTRGWETRTLADARIAFDAKRGTPTAWTPLQPGYENGTTLLP